MYAIPPGFNLVGTCGECGGPLLQSQFTYSNDTVGRQSPIHCANCQRIAAPFETTFGPVREMLTDNAELIARLYSKDEQDEDYTLAAAALEAAGPQELAPVPGECGEPAELLARIAAQQAKIDAWMMEFFPDEMSAEQIEGTQEQPCRARSGPPTESSGRPAVSAGPPSQADCDRQRDEALKIVGLARRCVDLDGTTARGMKDGDPYKGPANYLADALDAYDAARACEKEE